MADENHNPAAELPEPPPEPAKPDQKPATPVWNQGTAGAANQGNAMPETEDVLFVEFAKRYITLLAAVAAVPLLSDTIGVMPPPDNQDKLNVLSSFICLIAFASCFLLKNLLGKWIISKRSWVRCYPFFISSFLTLCAIACIAYYVSNRTPNSVRPGSAAPGSITAVTLATTTPRRDEVNSVPPTMSLAAAYLMSYALLVLALGVVLITSFAQARSSHIENFIQDHLPSERDAILQLLLPP